MQQFVPDPAAVDFGGRGLPIEATPLSTFTPMCAFIPKYQSLPFFVDDISGSRTLALFLVEGGASIRRVASALEGFLAGI